MIVGYARVSTSDQRLDSQEDAAKAAGAERIFADVITGSARHRPQLDRMLDQLRAGDVVVVTKYDRLARSLKDLLEIVEQIQEKGPGFAPLPRISTPPLRLAGWSSMSSPRSPSSKGRGSRRGPGRGWRLPAGAVE